MVAVLDNKTFEYRRDKSDLSTGELSESTSLDEFRKLFDDRRLAFDEQLKKHQSQASDHDNCDSRSAITFGTASAVSYTSSDNELSFLDRREPTDKFFFRDSSSTDSAATNLSFVEPLEEFRIEPEPNPIGDIHKRSPLSDMVKQITERRVPDYQEIDGEQMESTKSKGSYRFPNQSINGLWADELVNRSTSIESQRSYPRPLGRVRVTDGENESQATSRNRNGTTKIRHVEPVAEHEDNVADHIAEVGSECSTEIFRGKEDPFCGWVETFGGRTDSNSSRIEGHTRALGGISSPVAGGGGIQEPVTLEPPSRKLTDDSSMISTRISLSDAETRSYDSRSHNETQTHSRDDSNTLRTNSRDSYSANTLPRDNQYNATRDGASVVTKKLPVKTYAKQPDYERDLDTMKSTESTKPKSVKSATSRNRRLGNQVMKAVVFEKIKKRIRRSARILKVSFRNKFLKKCFKQVKQFAFTMRKTLLTRSLKGDVKDRDASSTIGKNDTNRIFIDELFASELLNGRGGDSSIVRASKYVKTGRDLLEEAAKAKTQNPQECRKLTRKAHAYAYVARQMAKTALMTKQAKKQALFRNPTKSDTVVSTDTSKLRDDADKVEQEEQHSWNQDWTVLRLLNFEDFIQSFTCLGACSNPTLDSSTLEVEEALEILAKMSEEEPVTVRGNTFSTEKRGIFDRLNGTTKSPPLRQREEIKGRADPEVVDGDEWRASSFADNMIKSPTGGATLNDLVANLQSFYQNDFALSSSSDRSTEAGDHLTIQGSNSLDTATDDQTYETEPHQRNDRFGWARLRDSVFSPDTDQEEYAKSRLEGTTRSLGSYTYSERLRHSSSSDSQSFTTAGTSLYTAGSATFGGESTASGRYSLRKNRQDVAETDAVATVPAETGISSCTKKKTFKWRLGRKVKL